MIGVRVGDENMTYPCIAASGKEVIEMIFIIRFCLRMIPKNPSRTVANTKASKIGMI